MLIISLLLSLVFTILAIIHINWALGNSWGLSKAVPTKSDSTELFIPGPLPTLSVAVGLLVFAAFYFIIPEPGNPKNWLFKYLGWILPSIFLLRCLGDFKYVGLFKSIKDTEFARMDSKYYVPLCFSISMMGYLVQLSRQGIF